MIRILLLLMLVSTSAAAKPDLQQILKNYLSSQNQSNFSGEYVHSQNGEIENLRIFRGQDPQGRMATRLIYLTGAKREIIRDSKGEICLVMDKQVKRIGSGEVPLPFTMPSNLQTLSAYYQLQLVGEEMIAGRKAWKIMIQPKDSFRYGYRIWLDQQTGVLLGFEKHDDQRVLEHMQFQTIQYADKVDIPLPDAGNAHLTAANSHASDSEPHTWRTGWLPAGFTMKQPEMGHMQLSQETEDYLVYSDGLSAISVFVEKLSNKDISGASKKSYGLMNAFSVAGNGYLVTVIGEVPMETLQKVALATVQEQ